MHRLEFAFILLMGLSLLSSACIEAKMLVREVNSNKITDRRVIEQKEKTNKDKVYISKNSTTNSGQNKTNLKPKSGKSKTKKKRNNTHSLKSNSTSDKNGNKKSQKPDSGKSNPRKEHNNIKEELSLSPM